MIHQNKCHTIFQVKVNIIHITWVSSLQQPLTDLHITPSSSYAQHIYGSIASTATSLNPPHRCARVVLGEFPVQTKPSSPFISPRFHPLCLPLHLSQLPPPPPMFAPLSMPRVAPTLWHQQHKISSAVSCADSDKYTSAFARRRLHSAKTHAENRQWHKRRVQQLSHTPDSR